MIVNSASPLVGQTGGVYEIKQSVTGSGGGGTVGGEYSIEGTAGQTVTDQSAQLPFLAASGFWQSIFVPTAAGVSISGRIRTEDSLGIRNAIVVMTDSRGAIQTTRTGAFGYFRFDDVEAGQTVTISVTSKRFFFQPIILNVGDEITGLEITGFP